MALRQLQQAALAKQAEHLLCQKVSQDSTPNLQNFRQVGPALDFDAQMKIAPNTLGDSAAYLQDVTVRREYPPPPTRFHADPKGCV